MANATKEKALRRAAERLNAAGITWAVGGGWMLQALGATRTWHDFDILVTEEDAPRADAILSKLGMRTPRDGDSFRCSYHFDGADVELYAPPVMRNAHAPGESPLYHVIFNADSVAATLPVQGVEVPIMYPEDWLVIYGLLGEDKRWAELVMHFLTHTIPVTERFDKVLQEPIPLPISDVVEVLENVTNRREEDFEALSAAARAGEDFPEDLEFTPAEREAMGASRPRRRSACKRTGTVGERPRKAAAKPAEKPIEKGAEA